MRYSRDTPFWSGTLDMYYLMQLHYTDTWPSSLSADLIMPGIYIRVSCRLPVCGTTLDGWMWHSHGWEIAVILWNFRKTKLSKSKFLFFFFFFYTLFQHVCNARLDDFRFATYANIAFQYFTALRPPSRHLSLHTHDTNIRAWNSSQKRGFSQK